MAGILTACTAISLLPAMSGGIMEVRAAQVSTDISVTAYATAEQLKNSDNFALSADYKGGAKQVSFGKDGSGNAQYWYIAGADSAAEANGELVLLAATPLLEKQKFQTTVVNNSNVEGTYAGTAPTEVYPNHYGSSSVRDALQGLEADTAYFSAAEQELMKETTVYTYDTKNKSTYSTTDKLYLAYGSVNNEYITVGANSADNMTAGLKVDTLNPYINKGLSFWLRSTTSTSDNTTCMAQTGAVVSGQWSVNVSHDVCPVFNLDMSSVLFASVVPVVQTADVASGNLSTEDAFVIRADGSSKLSGIKVSNTETEVKVNPAANKAVTLVVQGNDGTNNWFYASDVSSEKTVSASTIQSALGLKTAPNMDDCKIWVETTEDSVTYAVKSESENKSETPDEPETPTEKKNGFYIEDGAKYWYEDDVKQGTEGRGKEIYDPATDAWYWLDAVQGGAVAKAKDVYQESNGGKWVRYDENGLMIKGWSETEDGKYYFDLITGAMAKGNAEIDGAGYYFDIYTGILQ